MTNIVLARDPAAQRMFSVRKRSDSNKCFLCESEASATNVFCSESEASATKRPVGTEINYTFW
ncbi:hypothetical protein [Lysinibacillus xylanilyticus]|uniref:hypothetical protein n=1 Tax=Lysinibacillus xylanilyticus TaxID=582475 RepID=UPI002B25409F|nr:hypothetical protein [Lysinibacillus xylanilyticus]